MNIGFLLERRVELKKIIILMIALFLAKGDGYVEAEFIFGAPTNLGPEVNSIASDGSPCISSDGLTLYFDSQRAGGFGDWDIWVTTRESINDDWGTPEPLPAPVNSIYADAGPSISADELSLYFASERPGGYGSFDIWVSRRKTREEPWGTPVNLGLGVNSFAYENHPSISADGLTLYFDALTWLGYYDICVAFRATTYNDWDESFVLSSIVNSMFYELSPCISSDGLNLFFDRRSVLGDRDIWVATWKKSDDYWSEPVFYGSPLNTLYQDTDPSIQFDGSMLYFASTRPGGVGGQDIWQMSIATVRIIPDFNNDGRVDFEDFSRLAQHWMQDEPSVDISPAPEGDGIVDYKDMAGLAEYWLAYPGLLAHWKLDEREGKIARDSFGGNDGALHGGLQWQPTGGKVKGALQFDGVDDYVSTNYALNPNNGEFSVFVWIKGGLADQVIISQARIDDTGMNWLCIDPIEGRLMTGLIGTERSSLPLISQAIVTDGIWHHISLVWDGSYRILYVDDAEVAKDSAPLSGLQGATGGLYFGAGSILKEGTFWSGLIDDVRIYEKAINP